MFARYLSTLLLSLVLLAMGCLPAGDTESVQISQLEAQASAGDRDSQYQLGIHYTVNNRWAWDLARGYRWFLAAGEQGHADAQYMAGMAKLLGRGTDTDESGAATWLERAAYQGQERAQYQLGQLFLNGVGVAKETAWGRQWLEQAALNGHGEAPFLLAALFAGGVGGAENRGAAWCWLEVARERGQRQAAKALTELDKKITPAEKSAGAIGCLQGGTSRGDGLFGRPLVRYLQSSLVRLGYPAGAEDGIEGPATRAAVSAYLRANGLPKNLSRSDLIQRLRQQAF